MSIFDLDAMFALDERKTSFQAKRPANLANPANPKGKSLKKGAQISKISRISSTPKPKRGSESPPGPCPNCGSHYFFKPLDGGNWQCGTCSIPPTSASTLTLPGATVDAPEPLQDDDWILSPYLYQRIKAACTGMQITADELLEQLTEDDKQDILNGVMTPYGLRQVAEAFELMVNY